MTIQGNYFGSGPVHVAGGLKIGSSDKGSNYAGSIAGIEIKSGKELIPADTLKQIAEKAVDAYIKILENPEVTLGMTPPKVILEISYPSEAKGDGKFVAKIPEIIPGAKPEDVVDIKATLYTFLAEELDRRSIDVQKACADNSGPTSGEIYSRSTEEMFQVGIMHDGRSMISYLAGETKDRRRKDHSETASLVNIISGGGYGMTFAIAKDGKVTEFINPEDGHQEISPATREKFAPIFANQFQRSAVSKLEAVEPMVAGGKKGYGFHMIWTNLCRRINEAETATEEDKEKLSERADKAAKALGLTVEEVKASALNKIADANYELTGEQIVTAANQGDKAATAITESIAEILARRLVRYAKHSDSEQAIKVLEAFKNNDFDLLVSGGAGAGIFSVPRAKATFITNLEPIMGNFERGFLADRMKVEALPDDGALLRARAAAAKLAA